MGETSHTAGPWFALDDCTASGLEIRGGGYHYPLARMCSYWDGPGPRAKEAKANYVLMAAAPELLEALELVVGSLRFERIEDDLNREVLRRVEAAIAKVTT